MLNPLIIIFPFTAKYYIKKRDREVRNNINTLRNMFEDLVKTRRLQMKDKNFIDRGDLLSILL